MRRFWGVVGGMFVPAAFLVAPAGAAGQVPTGDTCTAVGSGSSYTLTIVLPANAPPQGGFAFGVPGAKVTGVKTTGTQGGGVSTSITE